MAITQTKTQNEFLVRWNDAGVLSGGHVIFREAIVKDGVEISSKMGDAIPVAMAGASGFPLTQILDLIHISALADNEAKAAEIATLKTAKTDADTARDGALAEKDAKTAEIAALTAQLAAMQPPADSFTRKAIKVALSDAGLLDSFDVLISDPQDGPQKLAMIAWEEDDAFTQTSPALVLTFARMALTEAQIAALFVAAAKL